MNFEMVVTSDLFIRHVNCTFEFFSMELVRQLLVASVVLLFGFVILPAIVPDQETALPVVVRQSDPYTALVLGLLLF